MPTVQRSSGGMHRNTLYLVLYNLRTGQYTVLQHIFDMKQHTVNIFCDTKHSSITISWFYTVHASYLLVSPRPHSFPLSHKHYIFQAPFATWLPNGIHCRKLEGRSQGISSHSPPCSVCPARAAPPQL